MKIRVGVFSEEKALSMRYPSYPHFRLAIP